MLSDKICKKARFSKDARFDGKFFTAVKTTRIYCRSICPVSPPKEENVTYFATAIEAANAGYRPCLRCRPDSAPGSSTWIGVNAKLDKAISLINAGELQEGSIITLAEKLSVSDRYIRQLFNEHLGTSPKAYALYQQCLFAKQLLHQTQIPITQIAFASGFSSIRRFNDCFKNQLNLTPSALRKNNKPKSNLIKLKLSYRPPYNWIHMKEFLDRRAINGLEWVGSTSYGRTFRWFESKGHFTCIHIKDKNQFDVSIEIDNIKMLKPVVNNIKRILDLNVDIQVIEKDLAPFFSSMLPMKKGVRLPGIWNMFEAGIRAILGQHISVLAAKKLVEQIVEELGEKHLGYILFPTPESILESELDFFKMPMSRKNTLHNLAKHFLKSEQPENADQWINLKGIGPWTINYAKMRGESHTDIFMAGDLGVKKAMDNQTRTLNIEEASPWRSYLTFHLWSQI